VAYALWPVTIDGHHVKKGEVMPVPHGAGSVDMDDLVLKKTTVSSKKPSAFKKGFWDIEVEFTFEYILTFMDCNNEIILSIGAYSTSKKKYCLFGSEGADTTVFSDFPMYTDGYSASGQPFVMVEGKAIGLKAEFRCNHRDRIPVDVAVTIGLFSIMKLFRIVCLNVESKGFCEPEECGSDCPVNPCEFFEGLEFPIDTFAPPPHCKFKEKQ